MRLKKVFKFSSILRSAINVVDKSTSATNRKQSSLTVLAVAIFWHLSASAVTADHLQYTCSNLDNRYYAVPGSHCTSYYTCLNKKPLKFDCQSGSIFDFDTQMCSRSPGICYEPVCTGRTDGFYQDTTQSCRRFFQCRGGRLHAIDNCPVGQLFNGHDCVAQDISVCELPETTAIAYPFSGDRRCYGVSDGRHSVDDTDCSRYVICKNEEVLDEIQCPNQHRFNEDQRKCVPAIFVAHCPRRNDIVCKDLPDGLHHDPMSSDCTEYLNCENGLLLTPRGKCVAETVFNGITCVPQPLFQCPQMTNSMPPSNICKRMSDGFVADPRRGCAAYIKCVTHRTKELFECPNGRYFDPEERQCVFQKFEEMRKCQASQPSDVCRHLADGYYQDKDSDCKKYFYCYIGNRTNYQCGGNRVFDGDSCVSSTSYTCPTKDPNACETKTDGYFKDTTSGCRAYYYCAAGKKFSYLCSAGQIFDGEKCVVKKAEHNCDSHNSCLGKLDGYYQDQTTGCRNYFYCLNEERATTITCRGSKLFDGTSCVSHNTYTCPTSQKDSTSNCISRICEINKCIINGFHADLSSGCSKYFFCIDGNKTELECTDGFVFNGDICVPREKFNCPQFCPIEFNGGICPM